MLKRIFELKENVTGESIPEFATTLEVIMTEAELIFDFFCKNSKYFSFTTDYNGPVFKGDACEIFLSSCGDVSRYYEIEVAPNGCVFLADIINDGNLNSKNGIVINYIDDCFVTAKVEKFNDVDYRCMISIPLEKIRYDENKGIKFNAYRIETEGGYTDKNLLSLNPTFKYKFHCPKCFIDLK